jgi:hypothetical protein
MCCAGARLVGRGGVVGEDLVELLEVLHAALVDFQPEVFSGEDCAVLAEELAALEKACAAMRARAGGAAEPGN